MVISAKRLKEKRKRRNKFKKFTERHRNRWSDPEAIREIDYKNVEFLQKLITSQGKIYSRKRSGACARAQVRIKVAIKRARFLGLLPYTG